MTCLPQSLQLGPHLARGAEKRILHRFLGCAQRVADSTQPHSLVVPHLKNHPFARRARLERSFHFAANFLAQDLALPIRVRPGFSLVIKEIAVASLLSRNRTRQRRLILPATAAAA